MWWVGEKTVDLVIIVRNAADDSPIENASVTVFVADSKQWRSNGRTDLDGKVRFQQSFGAAGTKCPIRRTGHFNLNPFKLKVDAAGYKRFEAALEDHLTVGGWPLYGPPLPPVEIRIRR